ncbi:MAG: hypothetical protein M3357_18315 [Actinomycetota bacterium]|nr:hypothetical protein [Actinomycetota bacterium]
MTLLSVTEWLELGVFVGLACGTLEQWRRRREEAAAWLAVTFALLGGILLADRFVPYCREPSAHSSSVRRRSARAFWARALPRRFQKGSFQCRGGRFSRTVGRWAWR